MSINAASDRNNDIDAVLNENSGQSTETVMREVDPLDELKDLDLLLEDIEDKIAPLAL